MRLAVSDASELARDARELVYAQAVLATVHARRGAPFPPLPATVARAVAGLETERLRRGAVSGAQPG